MVYILAKPLALPAIFEHSFHMRDSQLNCGIFYPIALGAALTWGNKGVENQVLVFCFSMQARLAK